MVLNIGNDFFNITTNTRQQIQVRSNQTKTPIHSKEGNQQSEHITNLLGENFCRPDS